MGMFSCSDLLSLTPQHIIPVTSSTVAFLLSTSWHGGFGRRRLAGGHSGGRSLLPCASSRGAFSGSTRMTTWAWRRLDTIGSLKGICATCLATPDLLFLMS